MEIQVCDVTLSKAKWLLAFLILRCVIPVVLVQ